MSETNNTSTSSRVEQGVRHNGRVGQTLVFESERVRVWLIALKPGEYLPPHCHVLDYFWTATTAGRSRSVYADGKVMEKDYAVGDTQHFTFKPGEHFVHDLLNIGDTVLSFTTVEFLDSKNRPLQLEPMVEESK